MTFGLFILNELMMLLMVIIIFPGLLPPKDGMEWFVAALMVILMSFVWWIFLAVSPITFGALWLFGDMSLDNWRTEWPWNKF